MEIQYVYLALGLMLLSIMVILAVVRRDLVRPAVLLGLVGIVLGPVSEFLYFRDYWRPPTTMGVAHLSPEDALFGFVIIAIGVMVYPALFRRRFSGSNEPRRRREFCLLFAGGVVLVLILNLILGVNSIIATIVAPSTMSLIMLYLRRDLVTPALYSAVLVVGVALLVYVPLFGLWAPEFWHRYWLLKGTSMGVMIPGSIPITELAWYASTGFMTGMAYPFITGKRFTAVK